MVVGPKWLSAPGGSIGQLSQYRVDFEDNERVCLDYPTSGSVTSGSTLVDNLNRIRAWLSPAKWFMPHATEPPSMYVYVEPGIAYLHGTTGSPIVFPGGFTSGSFVHESSGSPRIDLLYLEGNTGTLQVEQGTPSSSPSAPWPLSGSPFPIAEVYIRHCSGSIFNRCSSGSATDNYIYRDVRPFITFPGAGGGGGGLVDHAHTVFDGGQLDWDDIWTDAAHTHSAAGEGGQLDHGAALTDASMQDDDHRIYLKESEFTTKGDILVGTGVGTFTPLAVGANDEVLTADDGEASGVKWGTVSSGSGVSGGFMPFWEYRGTLAIVAGAGTPMRMPYAGTIEAVLLLVEDQGTSGSTVVDVNLNSISIYPVSPKPTVTWDDGDNYDVAVPDTTAFAQYDEYNVDFDSVATAAETAWVIIICTMSAGGGLAAVVNDTTPQLGGNLDLNDHNIVLKFEPTADDTAQGLITTVTVDTNTNGIGSPLMIAADGHFDDADASGSTTSPAVVIALEAGTGSKKVLLHGIMRNDGWAWVTGPGTLSLIYLSEDVGALTQIQPTTTDAVIQPVGWAMSDDVMYFCPSLIYFTHT